MGFVKTLKTFAVASALFGTGLTFARVETPKAIQPLTPVLEKAQSELHKIIDKVSPSVVTILTYKEIKVSVPVEPFFPPEFRDLIPPQLRKFFPFGSQPMVKKE